jgi:hypothetical protein
MRIAHISRNFNGRFCPTRHPLLQGPTILVLQVFDSMETSVVDESHCGHVMAWEALTQRLLAMTATAAVH